MTANASERYRKDPNVPRNLDLKPVSMFYLDEAFEKLCKQVRIVLNIKDINGKVAYLLKEAIEKSKGKIPLEMRIMETNNVFNSDFSNHHYKINPEDFIKNLSLPVDYKIELV
jgi:hypothetical protein